MSVAFVILGFLASLAVVILKALAVDQIRGQIQRRIAASVDATIASLPPELAAEWEEEWRAELAATISMPITAARYARGLRRSARQLLTEAALVRADALTQRQQRRREMNRMLAARGVMARLRWIIRNVDGLLALFFAGTVGVLAALDMLGTDLVIPTILLVLALLTAALLKDRADRFRRHAEAMFALLIAVSVGIWSALDMVSLDLANSAVLLVLALLAVTILKDRPLAASRASAVRQLTDAEVGQEHTESHRQTDQWFFKGGTGSDLRAATLGECVENARRERRPLRMQLEIIDPTDEALCTAYSQFRSSLTTGSDSTGESWTVDRTRKEAFATILAACWYRQRFTLLTIDVGLSKTMTTFRWDISSRSVIMTPEGSVGAALIFEKGMPYYRAYSCELVGSFKQARRVHLDRAVDLVLSEEPTVDQTRKLFALLDLELPGSFSDRDVSDVILKALGASNPSGSGRTDSTKLAVAG